MKATLFIIASSLIGAFGAMAQETQPTTSASSQPTTGASTQPTTDASGNPFSRANLSRREERNTGFPVQKLTGTQYAALEQRSIFAKGYFRPSSDGSFDPSKVVRPPDPPAQVTPPEHNLVFVGATEFDEEYVAFIEDFSGGKVQMLKTGDAVGRGKIGPISLNYMDYIDKAGKSVRVAIGKNLEGTDAPTTRPSGGYSGAPDGATTAPIGSGDPNSIEEKLRRRRAAGY